MKCTAVVRTLFCHGVRSGRTKLSANAWRPAGSNSPSWSIRAAEYAASACVAGSPGESSSASRAAGRFVRSPSSRATASVPKRDGGASPAVFAAWVKSRAVSVRPRATTRRESSAAIVTLAEGFADVTGCVWVRPATIASSSPRVSESLGRAAAALAIKPAATTVLSSACAHEVPGLAAAVAGDSVRSVTSAQTYERRRQRIPVLSATRRMPLISESVDVEITPQPDEMERRAILEALEQEARAAAPASPWRQDGLGPGPEDEDDQAGAPPRQSRGATRA